MSGEDIVSDQMGLEHIPPPDILSEELAEVAGNASDLLDLLTRGLNFPLPDDFPNDQITDICRSLLELPRGTAEGCRAPLEYARNRLPSIRREYISRGSTTSTDTNSYPTRGAVLDKKLGALISSVATALDEYRNLAAVQDFEDEKPEPGIKPQAGVIEPALQQSRQLDAKLAATQTDLGRIANPDSLAADTLMRQVSDARTINRMATAEVQMPKVMPGWLRSTTEALGKCPGLIRESARCIRGSVDILEGWVNCWNEIQQDLTSVILDGIRKACTQLVRTANILDGTIENDELSSELPPAAEKPNDTEDCAAATGTSKAIERRDEIQESLKPLLSQLEQIDTYLRLDTEIGGTEGHGGVSITAKSARENRLQLVEKLMVSLKELEKIQTYLSIHRDLTAGAPTSDQAFGIVQPDLSRAGSGIVQGVFEQLAQYVMRDVGRPVNGGEIAELLRARGHPIGGTNETRTAWNRLWLAKKRGVLVNITGLGYWPAGDALSEEAKKAAKEAAFRARSQSRKKRKGKRPTPTKRPGSPRGRPALLSKQQIALAKERILAGIPMKEVAVELGGISPGSIARHIPGGVRKFRNKHRPNIEKAADKTKEGT